MSGFGQIQEYLQIECEFFYYENGQILTSHWQQWNQLKSSWKGKKWPNKIGYKIKSNRHVE